MRGGPRCSPPASWPPRACPSPASPLPLPACAHPRRFTRRRPPLPGPPLPPPSPRTSLPAPPPPHTPSPTHPRLPPTPLPLPAPGAGGGLLSEELKPRAGLPPLLVNLSDRPAERLHYLGTSFGLTQQLYSFWRRSAFRPVYLRQTPSDVTGGCGGGPCALGMPAPPQWPPWGGCGCGGRRPLSWAGCAGWEGRGSSAAHLCGGAVVRGREEGGWEPTLPACPCLPLPAPACPCLPSPAPLPALPLQASTPSSCCARCDLLTWRTPPGWTPLSPTSAPAS